MNDIEVTAEVIGELEATGEVMAGSTNAVWGQITGDIEDQTDLTQLIMVAGQIMAETSKAYTDTKTAQKADASYVDTQDGMLLEAVNKKVNNDGVGVSGAMYQLDFNSNAVTDETQIVVQENATKWVRRKAQAIADYLLGKFVSYTSAQTLTAEQRKQARNNIKAATGGARRLPKATEEQYGYHDISSYTSITHTFTAPTDGYVLLRKSSGTASAFVDGYTILGVNSGTGSVFVGQGMPIYVSGSPNAAGFLEWRPEEEA